MERNGLTLLHNGPLFLTIKIVIFYESGTYNAVIRPLAELVFNMINTLVSLGYKAFFGSIGLVIIVTAVVAGGILLLASLGHTAPKINSQIKSHRTEIKALVAAICVFIFSWLFIEVGVGTTLGCGVILWIMWKTAGTGKKQSKKTKNHP